METWNLWVLNALFFMQAVISPIDTQSRVSYRPVMHKEFPKGSWFTLPCSDEKQETSCQD